MKRGSLPLALGVACIVGFTAPFAATFVLEQQRSSPNGADRLSIYSRRVGDGMGALGTRPSPMPICFGPAREWRGVTCLVDGDTGWERGRKWRLQDVDTPEITKSACANAYQKGIAARDRLQYLMSAGYRIDWLGRTDHYGRQLVRVRLANGSDAGRILLREGWRSRGPRPVGAGVTDPGTWPAPDVRPLLLGSNSGERGLWFRVAGKTADLKVPHRLHPANEGPILTKGPESALKARRRVVRWGGCRTAFSPRLPACSPGWSPVECGVDPPLHLEI